MTDPQADQAGDINVRTLLVTIILTITGLGLFAVAQWAPFLGAPNSSLRDVVGSIGVFCIGVLVLGWLDEKVRMERHFSQFRHLLRDEIRGLDTIQSKCLKLGIANLYETRWAFYSDYSFAGLIALAKPKSHILCVARSLFHFLNKQTEIEAGLKKGIQYDLVCLDPDEATEQMRSLVHLHLGDLDSALTCLDSIAKRAQELHYEGGIELRYHRLHLPDSILAIETDDGKVLFWDLSFGRDLTDKRIVMLKPEAGNLGQDLLQRYRAIWSASTCKLKILKGVVHVNELS